MNDGLAGLAERESCIEGVKFDEGKLRIDLIPPEALEGLARVLTHGATKYGDHNWEKGFAWSRAYAACLRHLILGFWRGEDTDESGLPHIDHALTNLIFLSTFQKRKIGTDDRTILAQANDAHSRHLSGPGAIRSEFDLLDSLIQELESTEPSMGLHGLCSDLRAFKDYLVDRRHSAKEASPQDSGFIYDPNEFHSRSDLSHRRRGSTPSPDDDSDEPTFSA